MIADLKPYPAYSDSEVDWLGEVPEHWYALRCRYLFREFDRRSKLGAETHLSMSQKLGLVPSSMVERSLISKSYAGGKLCDRDDLVLNRLKAHLGVFSRARQGGVISPDYTVLRKTRQMAVPFFEHVLRSPACRVELRVRAKGVVEGFWRLYTDDFYDIRVPVPPVEEQELIVRFLANVDRRIQRYIRAKQKLIKLLEEQKQAIIHRAVTRGLDPGVRLKPSGVEWLGEVPKHWSLIPNRSLFRIRKVLVGSRRAEYQLLSLTKKGVIVRDMTTGKGKFSDFWERSQEVRPGDLVFCLFDVDETPRTVGLSRHLGMISGDYTVMECADELFGPFLECFYKAMDDRKLLRPLYTGLRKRISKPLLLAAKMPIPSPHEQTAIVEYIDTATAYIEASISRTEREMELLDEYRTRLIADVVTGKLDVREAASRLPDEIEEASFDDGEELAVGNAEPEDAGFAIAKEG